MHKKVFVQAHQKFDIKEKTRKTTSATRKYEEGDALTVRVLKADELLISRRNDIEMNLVKTYIA